MTLRRMGWASLVLAARTWTADPPAANPAPAHPAAPASEASAAAPAPPEAVKVPALPPGPDIGPAAAPAERAWRLQLAGRYALASDSDSFDNPFGGEVQWQHWLTKHLGYAAAAGAQSWPVKSGTRSFEDMNAYDAHFSGDVIVYPIGGSLLVRSDPDRTILRYWLEAGVRYAYADGDATVAFHYTDHWGRDLAIKDTVDIDNRFLAVVGLYAAGAIPGNVGWVLGVGYQFDLHSGDENWHHRSIANEFEGVLFSAGLTWPF